MTLKVGDKVRVTTHRHGENQFGQEGEVIETDRCHTSLDVRVKFPSGGTNSYSKSDLELITEGPVRTVTRTVTETTITPGTYARITVNDEGKAGMVGLWLNSGHYFSPSDLRAAAAVLLELAGALDSE